MDSSNQDCGVVSCHLFEDIIEERTIVFKILKMKDCLFVWIGDRGTFDNLAVAMKTPYNLCPVSTSLMGQLSGDESCSLAQNLSRKTGKQVFASCNFNQTDSNTTLFVTKRLMIELDHNPDKF